MTETWREPERDLPVVGRPDVLVVGAGSAGRRCISTSRYVHQATKEIPAAMATGEAAGAAGALAADVDVHGVDVDALRRDLAAVGAIV